MYPQQVFWWYQTEGSGWYTWRLCWHSAGPWQAGGMGREKDGHVQDPTSGEEEPLVLMQVLSARRTKGSLWTTSWYKPEECPYGQESKWYLGAHWEECEVILPLCLAPGEEYCVRLWTLSTRKKRSQWRWSSGGHKDEEGSEASLLWEETGGTVF